MRYLDGSYGEGGGQILRTSLSLSALLGEPVRLANIRAGRPKPGLCPQHLTVVKALAEICQAEVEGAALDSQELSFRPRRLRPGRYVFDVAEKTGSAGAVTLIAQALLPPLLKAGGRSQLTLRGGTHVPWSPTAHYLEYVFLPALGQMGVEVKMRLAGWGWYPKGGGEVELMITPAEVISGVSFVTPAPPATFQALSVACQLPEHVRWRQAARLREALGGELRVREQQVKGAGAGSLVFLWGPQAGFSALGARGKPAEKVADEVVAAYRGFRESRAAVDRHLADQLALYLPGAGGPSEIVTASVSAHLLTNLWVIEQFLGPVFQVEGRPGERGRLRCSGGKGWS